MTFLSYVTVAVEQVLTLFSFPLSLLCMYYFLNMYRGLCVCQGILYLKYKVPSSFSFFFQLTFCVSKDSTEHKSDVCNVIYCSYKVAISV